MSRLVAALVILLSTPGVAQTVASAENGAQLFVEKCSGCHSVGGGVLAAPDLIGAAQWPAAEVRKAVVRMEDFAGPLNAEETDSLVALLKDSRARDLIAGAENPDAPKPAVVPLGSSSIGRGLFFGTQRFQNGGSPCFACHAAGGRGGNLAADLTLTNARMGQSALVFVITQPAFPLMKGAYSKRPVTEEEAFHVAAFLGDPAIAAAPGLTPQPERASVLHGAAAGAAVAVLAGVGLILRTRRAGVRSRMVRAATGEGGK